MVPASSCGILTCDCFDFSKTLQRGVIGKQASTHRLPWHLARPWGLGGGAEPYLHGARSAPASSRGVAGPAWGHCSAEMRPLLTVPVPLWMLPRMWRGQSLWGVFEKTASEVKGQTCPTSRPPTSPRTQTQVQDEHTLLPPWCLRVGCP